MGNKRMKAKKLDKKQLAARKSSIISAIAAAAILVAIVLLCIFFGGGKGPNSGENQTPEVIGNNGENQTPAALEIPGEGKLDMDSIQGFTAKDNVDLPELDDTNLVVEAIGRYNGLFTEDGSDTAAENVMSLIVTNKGTQMLQIAQIALTADEKTYEFQVTTLPAGASVLVLEQNKATCGDSREYAVTNCATGYLGSTSLMEDELQISGTNGKITVKNIGDKTYSKLYVYYKSIKRGGVYMGGITYRVPVENLAPGATVEVDAGHYRTESGQIMMVEAMS